MKMTGVAPGMERKVVEKTALNSTTSLLDWVRNQKGLLMGDAPCLNDSDVITYMNSKETRKAINVPFNLPKWDICR